MDWSFSATDVHAMLTYKSTTVLCFNLKRWKWMCVHQPWVVGQRLTCVPEDVTQQLTYVPEGVTIFVFLFFSTAWSQRSFSVWAKRFISFGLLKHWMQLHLFYTTVLCTWLDWILGTSKFKKRSWWTTILLACCNSPTHYTSVQRLQAINASTQQSEGAYAE